MGYIERVKAGTLSPRIAQRMMLDDAKGDPSVKTSKTWRWLERRRKTDGDRTDAEEIGELDART